MRNFSEKLIESVLLDSVSDRMDSGQKKRPERVFATHTVLVGKADDFEESLFELVV